MTTTEIVGERPSPELDSRQVSGGGFFFYFKIFNTKTSPSNGEVKL